MKCENAADLIVDSLLDSLDEAERRELEAHLASCPTCSAEAEKMKEVWHELAELRGPEASVEALPRAAVELGRQLSGGRRRSRFATTVRVAAAIALLLLGAAGGYLARGDGSPVVTSADDTTFMLLVRADDALTVTPGPELVQEYVDWASSLGEQGRLVGGHKLTEEPGRWVSTAMAETRTRSDVSGYFLITAADYDDAIRIAGSSPHIRYGGTLEIRQIDPLQ